MQHVSDSTARVFIYKNATKYNDAAVHNEILKLWNTGVSIGEIGRKLSLSKTQLTRITKNWTKKYEDKRYIDVFIAHCLITEHGFTRKEAAQAFGVHHASMCRALNREKALIEEYYEQWKGAHVKWRRSLKVQTINE
jgi:hypothetical protein